MPRKAASKQTVGLIGLAVMGENLVLNIESKGFPAAVYNRTAEKTRAFMEKKAGGKKIAAAYSLKEFAGMLEKPRKIFLMVKAGEAVDSFIGKLKPLLSRGDIILDGGNSFFKDTERRAAELEKRGLRYIGSGVSGGEEGALRGPCIMPGGQKEAYRAFERVLTRIAAQTSDGACCAYIGPRGAGHYVKMVHNGIEYGNMQLISECYDIMRTALGMKAGEIREAVSEWNNAELGSYLLEITVDILEKTDESTGRPLVDLILDQAEQKGTGKWTSQNSFDAGVPTPTINAAVEARIMSAYKKERVQASKKLAGPVPAYGGDRKKLLAGLRNALYAAEITSYAQGMALMSAASAEYGYGLDLSEIARIWKGGCIIRARLLDDIRQAYRKDASLCNILVDGEISKKVNSAQDDLRLVVQTACGLGIPCAALCASLAYIDSYRKENLPANLIQAQRDCFGAHTYKRTDKDGVFHTEWQA